MRTKVKFLSIILACFITVMMASSSFSADVAKGRKTISDAERALAMWEVQNVMSKHAYYHAAGMHLEELANIWVDEKGPNAKTAHFASPSWKMLGVAAVKKYYGQTNQDNKVKELEAVSKLYPEIKNVKENLGAGHEYAMHTQTTAIIEVAGDGKSAKGIWYSPGIGLSGRINGTEVSYGGTFFWEKYGADFIKENGEWKIWHCQMWYDFTPSLPTSMTSSIGGGGMGGGAPAAGGQGGQGGSAPAAGGQGGQGGSAPAAGGQGGQGGGAPAAGGQGGQGGGAPAAGGQGAPGGDKASGGAIEAGEKMSGGQSSDMIDNTENNYESYSVKRVPTIEPKFPEAYYTFSETFSY